MKIKYLGTAAAEGIPALFCDCENCKKSRELGGRNIRSRSQAIIDDTVLIDFPADTYVHFLMHNVPMNKIKTCIITHSHHDHLYTSDIEVRKEGFANLDMKEPLTFYSAKSGYDMLNGAKEKFAVSDKDVRTVEIEPFKQFEADGYKIMPIKAEHDPRSTPVVYVIEKDGRSIFYANDSSEYDDESMKCLKSLGKPIDVISLDCTHADTRHFEYAGHLSLERCAALRKKLIAENIADEKTTFVLNHFSHNGANVVYDDFVKIAAEHDFLVSYDGMELEF